MSSVNPIHQPTADASSVEVPRDTSEDINFPSDNIPPQTPEVRGGNFVPDPPPLNELPQRPPLNFPVMEWTGSTSAPQGVYPSDESDNEESQMDITRLISDVSHFSPPRGSSTSEGPIVVTCLSSLDCALIGADAISLDGRVLRNDSFLQHLNEASINNGISSTDVADCSNCTSTSDAAPYSDDTNTGISVASSSLMANEHHNYSATDDIELLPPNAYYDGSSAAAAYISDCPDINMLVPRTERLFNREQNSDSGESMDGVLIRDTALATPLQVNTIGAPTVPAATPHNRSVLNTVASGFISALGMLYSLNLFQFIEQSRRDVRIFPMDAPTPQARSSSSSPIANRIPFPFRYGSGEVPFEVSEHFEAQFWAIIETIVDMSQITIEQREQLFYHFLHTRNHYWKWCGQCVFVSPKEYHDVCDLLLGFGLMSALYQAWNSLFGYPDPVRYNDILCGTVHPFFDNLMAMKISRDFSVSNAQNSFLVEISRIQSSLAKISLGEKYATMWLYLDLKIFEDGLINHLIHDVVAYMVSLREPLMRLVQFFDRLLNVPLDRLQTIPHGRVIEVDSILFMFTYPLSYLERLMRVTHAFIAHALLVPSISDGDEGSDGETEYEEWDAHPNPIMDVLNEMAFEVENVLALAQQGNLLDFLLEVLDMVDIQLDSEEEIDEIIKFFRDM